MSTLLLSHDDCLRHETPSGHPERVARLEVLNERLSSKDYVSLLREDAPLAERRHLEYCHPSSYIDRIEALVPNAGYASIDGDTHLSPGSWNASLRAVGACTRAVDMVVAGAATNAFCAVRPPGHHAETSRAMGFCVFGTVAIGARHAMVEHELESVAIVDFDVHHGNGTSDLVWDHERIVFASTHEWGIFPGSGAPDEQGRYGQIINMPLRHASGSEEFREAFAVILDRLDAARPELILVSAGFDAHYRDPLASLRLEADDFAWATESLCDIADAHADGRLVASLEGGYDLEGLTESASAHITVLMNRSQA
ncbi:MAG: histone deacetylase family protein [Rhodobacteraceae bacterium]|nr:histone deacetylase family protein [Paracoccaceae bacterium]